MAKNWKILPVRLLSGIIAAVLPASSACSADTPEKTAELLRLRMVERQIVARGVKDERVLEAMRTIPRHRFVPPEYRSSAYDDAPAPIGFGQTISQPYIVAYMTEILRLKPGDRVLEIGTGSGYQAAVLAEIVREVYTIEIVPELAERARSLLRDLGYESVQVRTGDGYLGWPEHAPYDAVIVTAAPDTIPSALIEQLADGGRMVVPVGEAGSVQELTLLTRTAQGVRRVYLMLVRFVPLVPGDAER